MFNKNLNRKLDFIMSHLLDEKMHLGELVIDGLKSIGKVGPVTQTYIYPDGKEYTVEQYIDFSTIVKLPQSGFVECKIPGSTSGL